MPKIRSFVLSDFDQLIELWKELQTEADADVLTTKENASRMRQFIVNVHKQDKNQILVAESNGKLIGYIIFEKQRDFPLETAYKWAYVHDLFVHSEHRRKGLATKLLQRTVKYLKASGAEYVMLGVRQNNEAAIKLYHKLGFKIRSLTMQKKIS